MNTKILLFALMLFTAFHVYGQADDKRLEDVSKMAKKEVKEGWVRGGGIGIDLSGLGLINPRIGAGDNKFGIGGLGSFFIDYKRGKAYWSNGLTFQLAAQRFRVNKSQFQKSLDVIRFNSRYGYQIKNKLFGAIDLGAETMLLPSYPGNLLKPAEPTDAIQANLFSPIRVTLSPGLDYKHNDHFSVFFAPFGLKIIYVADQAIANLGIHGTQPVDENDPTRGYEKMFLQAGANLQLKYANKFFADHLSYTFALDLFSNYLHNPQNLDVLWGNTVDIAITKNLSLSLLGELFYDHDIDVNVDRNNNGIYEGKDAGEVGKRASMTGAYYLKYNKIF